MHYGEIFPVTYGQDRLNAPYSLRIVIQQPNLADPLGELSFSDLDPASRTSKIELGVGHGGSYSHQYNLSWQFGVGSRSTSSSRRTSSTVDYP
ncbi:MAG: hypothetical protein R2748_11380 [Bryobacterales bacterium]